MKLNVDAYVYIVVHWLEVGHKPALAWDGLYWMCLACDLPGGGKRCWVPM